MAGRGTLNVTSGGALTTGTASMNVAFNAGSQGNVVIAGGGSQRGEHRPGILGDEFEDQRYREHRGKRGEESRVLVRYGDVDRLLQHSGAHQAECRAAEQHKERAGTEEPDGPQVLEQSPKQRGIERAADRIFRDLAHAGTLSSSPTPASSSPRSPVRTQVEKTYAPAPMVQ